MSYLVTISPAGRIDDAQAAALEARVADAVRKARAGEVSVLCLQPGQVLQAVDVGRPPPPNEAGLPAPPRPDAVIRHGEGTPMPMKRKGA